MNCKDCKHFVRGYFERPTLEGDAVIVPRTDSYGMCLHEKIISDYVQGWLERETVTEPIDGLTASCDEGRGDLLVGENFGCIHFEPKL